MHVEKFIPNTKHSLVRTIVMTFFPYMLHFKAPKKIKILAAET